MKTNLVDGNRKIGTELVKATEMENEKELLNNKQKRLIVRIETFSIHKYMK